MDNELLECLKEALEVMGDWGPEGEPAWASRARALIAKIEGPKVFYTFNTGEAVCYTGFHNPNLAGRTGTVEAVTEVANQKHKKWLAYVDFPRTGKFWVDFVNISPVAVTA